MQIPQYQMLQRDTNNTNILFVAIRIISTHSHIGIYIKPNHTVVTLSENRAK